ncbi:MAG: endonuclease/exonuclease/phosphatase family protein [Clostridia bacterium]|nr:endonuclease/exonuclease/phosphatase family protein [Clostridia bacterium]
MKKGVIILIVLVAIAVAAGVGFGVYTSATTTDFGEIVIDGIPEKSAEATRVMSFNVRCADDPEGSINDRSQIVTAILEQYAPDSFGVQEATAKWMRILKKELGDRYACVGKARDYFGPFSEYSAVFYLKDKYNLIDEGTIWLSETPEKKSKSFDSACYRITTWAVLEDKETGKRYTHMNTHLDHVLESTRDGQAGVLLEKLEELQAEGNVIVTGDFNASPDEDVYKRMVAVTDDASLTAKNADTGITFHKYGKIEDEGQGAIDFIFTSKGVKADTYKVIRNTVEGMYPSDHYPIVADVIV